MSETHAPEKLQRKLGARHLNMIAIGGSIGTGLFLASGSTIANAGPGGALLAYSLIGIMIYFLMTSLGELATHTPTSGAFFTYGSRYVEEGFGFALGWNYWYNWAITVAFELVAVQFIMKFWFPDVPGFYWSALFLVIIFMINAMTVKGFGESEFWFSMVKVIAIVAFIIIGIAMIIKIMLTPGVATFGNWTYKEAPFVGGLKAMIGVAMIAGFSFQGTEMVGVAAGESKDPKKTIPLAIKQIFWRILLFYILCIFIIGTLIAYDDPNLLQAAATENIALSPFTLLYEKVGFAFAASLMNAVILTAILSAGNSGMYSSTRMLFDMAQQGRAPKWFAKLDNRGVPMNALYATTFIAAFCFLTTFIGEKQVFNWLLNMSGMCGFIVWLGIAISHYRFRKGYIAQGYKLEDLAYRAKFFPFAPWFAFILCSVIILGQNYQAVLGVKIDWIGLLSTYISLPLFLVIWLGYKWKNKTKLIPYDQMDVKPEQD
ncbi:lysine-specific permease [Acinetobacter baumannii 25307_8]|uniref:amino acid permease n=1 Tax=Acinetobacter baumannii TaxID=470 RepID=UPI0004520F23|nr:amino acid permease [Acinetobacter baumannii]EXH86381.1 lysine-specific permease [Acinetobacter baumannii 2887]EXI42310.1 lysine-specific permease [Acinetobacter baumannii 923118]EXT11959.1 lysine-specific permease [Acinetobacter baumannii 44895_8]EXT16074.1 lysine-specific permease [Acinetobacter baumannii 44895_5]EXT67745.1 lysine-specific permease [Acinetobacter baumannii 25307_8]